MTVQEITAFASLAGSVGWLLAVVLLPIAFMKLRNYFPERKEAITPEQLTASLKEISVGIRDSFNVEFGRLRASIDGNHNDVMRMIAQVEQRADQAYDLAQTATHENELLKQRFNDFDRLLVEKMDRLQDTVKFATQNRRRAGDAWDDPARRGEQ